MSTELLRTLLQVGDRRRTVIRRNLLALWWLEFALVAGVALNFSWPWPANGPASPAFLLAWVALPLAIAGAIVALTRRLARDPVALAHRVEAAHPELGTGLLAALNEEEKSLGGRLGYLQSAVVRQAIQHNEDHDWREVVPTRRLRRARFAQVASFTLYLAALTALAYQARPGAPGSRAADPAAIATADAFEVQVEPGDAEVERGAPLLVVARFPGKVPPDVYLAYQDASDSGTDRRMARALEDPTFAGRVESVASDATYRVEFAGGSSKDFQVKVFEYPEVRRVDAKLVFPEYTAIAPKVVEDIRHVTAVEGSELTLTFRINKEVAEAKLVDDQGAVTPLKKIEGENLYASTFTLVDPHRYKVDLLDKDGRQSKVPTEVAVNVTRNRPATVAMTQPSRDLRVSPVEELTLRADVADDFGVTRHGLSYAVPGQEPKELELPGPKPSAKKLKAEHVLAFEAMNAQPDQLVTYYFWAEDIGPDGQPRRTMGDMFFAEVRHFEEIFRQGESQSASQKQQQQQQQQGNAQQAEQLAELQKQVINATWKLVRRETRPKPSAEFADDAKTLRDSQQAAIDQADALGEKPLAEDSKADLAKAIASMKEAEKLLAEAAKGPLVNKLPPALAAEQAAYQALLRLRAREFEVTRQQRQQSSSSASASQRQQQQQLDQLELKEDQDRFEQQTTARAQTQQQQQAQEDRQVANRLKELAQRQADLNARLKEVQSALEAAKEQAARDEIERQLKRLRDQQQQVLRDTDELRERMEREENRDRMAEERKQVEQARENVRQAAEALEENKLSQAVNEGARAEKQLDQAREDLRKKSADRFADDLNEMREQARKLDEQQGQIADRLEAKDQDRQAQRSLRDADDRQQVQKGLEDQRQQLDKLLDRMRETVQQADETEPLLAKQLFEAVNQANQQAIPDALKQAEKLAEVGINPEAAKSARQAGQGIAQLREGVEKAAKSVLGDETAALKRAQAELEDLTNQVNREVARANPDEAKGPFDKLESPSQPGQRGQQQSGQGQQAQAGQGQPGQPGQQAQGQPGQPGERPRGQGQQGQQGQGQQGQGQQGQQGQGQQGQQGQGQGQQSQGQQGQGQGQGGQGGGDRQGGMRQASSPNGGGGGSPGGADGLLDQVAGRGAGVPGTGGPITGEGFRQWADRMRDVEELLQDPQLRAEAARIRDRARGAREEFKRHSKVPDPKALKEMVADPIRELRDRVAEEVRRRESPDSLVPIDRDPVPPRYTEGVRRYYERLGDGR